MSTDAISTKAVAGRSGDRRPRLAIKHNESPGQAWGISNPASLVRRFVQVFRLDRTTSGGPCYDRCLQIRKRRISVTKPVGVMPHAMHERKVETAEFALVIPFVAKVENATGLQGTT